MKYGRIPLSDVVPTTLIGLTNRKLARVLCVKEDTLRDWRALGVPLRMLEHVGNIKFPSPSDFEYKPTKLELDVANAYRSGKSVNELAEELYLTGTGVRALLNRAMPDYKEICEWKKSRLAFKLAWKKIDSKNRRRTAVENMLLCCYDDAVEIVGDERLLLDRTLKTPSAAYMSQRRNAGLRGIGWELTFVQWWDVWQRSGHWNDRGRGQGYCMARIGDTGPYAVGNVEIKTIGENFSESYYKHPWNKRFPSGGFGRTKED